MARLLTVMRVSCSAGSSTKTGSNVETAEMSDLPEPLGLNLPLELMRYVIRFGTLVVNALYIKTCNGRQGKYR